MHHIICGHHHFSFFAFLAPLGQNCIQLLFRLLLSVTQPGGFLKILRLDCGFLFKPDLFDFLLDFLNVRRPCHGVDARARAGFIHDIDRFIWKKTSGNITVGKSDGGLERFVGQFGLVMRFVFWAQTLQDLDCLIDGWCIHFYRLETALERRIFFDVFTILVHRRRAHALQFAPAKRGFDNV